MQREILNDSSVGMNRKMLPGLQAFEVTRINKEIFELRGHKWNKSKSRIERDSLYDLVQPFKLEKRATTPLVTEFTVGVQATIDVIQELASQLEGQGFPDETEFPET